MDDSDAHLWSAAVTLDDSRLVSNKNHFAAVIQPLYPHELGSAFASPRLAGEWDFRRKFQRHRATIAGCSDWPLEILRRELEALEEASHGATRHSETGPLSGPNGVSRPAARSASVAMARGPSF